jgi:hypothetical protein
MVHSLFAVSVIPGDELDPPLVIAGLAVLGRQNLQPQPLRLPTESLHVRSLHIATSVRMVRGDKVVDLVSGESRVARAHELLGGLGWRAARDDGATAIFQRSGLAARALEVHADRYSAVSTGRASLHSWDHRSQFGIAQGLREFAASQCGVWSIGAGRDLSTGGGDLTGGIAVSSRTQNRPDKPMALPFGPMENAGSHRGAEAERAGVFSS